MKTLPARPIKRNAARASRKAAVPRMERDSVSGLMVLAVRPGHKPIASADVARAIAD